jgi:hypothetical protein
VKTVHCAACEEGGVGSDQERALETSWKEQLDLFKKEEKRKGHVWGKRAFGSIIQIVSYRVLEISLSLL